MINEPRNVWVIANLVTRQHVGQTSGHHDLDELDIGLQLQEADVQAAAQFVGRVHVELDKRPQMLDQEAELVQVVVFAVELDRAGLGTCHSRVQALDLLQSQALRPVYAFHVVLVLD